MTNTKSTKRALLVSVMAMVICFTMLLGTTFAWFTDNEVNTGNIITAGTLKVDFRFSQDKGNTWEDASQGSIFEHTNWEPGYAEVRQIEISNVGSLAFNYKLKMYGTDSELASVIDVYYIKDKVVPQDRVFSGWTRLGTLSTVLADADGFGASTLLAQNPNDDTDVEIVTIALVMQTGAGNEYQGKTTGSFVVKVLATQMTEEIDSVNDQYDVETETNFPGATDAPEAP